MCTITLNLFGSPQIEIDGRPLYINNRKAVALLAYLAVSQKNHRRDSLATLFWPEHNQRYARMYLRQALYRLTKVLGKEHFRIERETIGLSHTPSPTVDVYDFQVHLEQARQIDNTFVDRAAIAHLEQVVDLYRDGFMSGFSLPDCPEFDAWQFFMHESLRNDQHIALQTLVVYTEQRQDYARALDYARRNLALDPLNEALHRQVMSLYVRTGQRSAALRQYQLCIAVLAKELDVPPSDETRALAGAIQQGTLAVESADLQNDTRPDQLIETATASTTNDKELRIVTVIQVGFKWAEAQNDSSVAVSTRHLRRLVENVCVPWTPYLPVQPKMFPQHQTGVSVIFGWPTAHEDDAERAVLAALTIRDLATEKALMLGIGISTGLVHIQQNSLDKVSDMFGSPLKSVARLWQRATAEQVLVDRATYRTTRDTIRYESMVITHETEADAGAIFQALAEHPAHHKTRGLQSVHPPMIGRHQEFDSLLTLWRRVRVGNGQAISVIGEAGVGKSRLLLELREQLAREEVVHITHIPSAANQSLSDSATSDSNVIWLEGRCQEMGIEVAFWPFRDMLRTYFGGQPDDDMSTRPRWLAQALDELAHRGKWSADEVAEMGAVLGNLLSVRFGTEWDQRLAQTDLQEIRYRILRGLERLLTALAQTGPVILLLEDLHWADHLSMDLVMVLLQTLAHAPLLVVCLYRPVHQHRSAQLAQIAGRSYPDGYTEIHLHSLEATASLMLVQLLVKPQVVTPAIQNWILARGQGNPFFLEEIIRLFRDKGWLAHPDKIEPLLSDPLGLTEPAINVTQMFNVERLVLDRLDQLEPESRRCLLQVAILGYRFALDIVQRLLPENISVPSQLTALEEAGLIYLERTTPEEEYVFSHVLLRDAIYYSIPPEHRVALHRQAAAAIEAVYADDLDAHSQRLAYHYSRSNLPVHARHYLYVAAENARSVNCHIEAIAYFRRILADDEQLAQISSSDRDLNLLLDTFWSMGCVLQDMGELEDALAAFRGAEELIGVVYPQPERIVHIRKRVADVRRSLEVNAQSK